MEKVNSVLLVIGILLALAFTFSCSSDGNRSDMDTSSDSVSGSSSSNRGSSSSATGSDSSNSSLIVSSSSFKESSSSSILENTDVSSSSEISSSSVHSSSSVEIEQSSSSIADTCNGVEYDNLNEFCFEDGIYEKCNDKIYNPTKHKCDESNSILQNHCNGTLYDTYLEYCINGILKNKGELIDDRDQKTYKTVDIGTQTWMAENLNYNANGSLCYNDDSNNCVIYGRLYNWTTAMANSESSSENPSGIRGICPSGWHLPSKAELEQLIDYVGGIEAAETKLKANSGLWRYNAGTNVSTLDNYNIGTDDYGFSALPGGFGGIAFGFDGGVFPEYWYRGSDIRWWSSTKHPTYNNEACFLRIGSVFWTGIRYERVLYWHSIRCVKD